MKYEKTDFLYLPVKDFVTNSILLDDLGWSQRVIAALIRSRTCLEGRYESNYGGWHTTKYALIQALKARNESGFASPIDLRHAYRLISAVPLRGEIVTGADSAIFPK